MEKKGTRSAQSVSKGSSSSDSKKSQDVGGGKLWPKGGRRREPTGANLSTNKSDSTSRHTKQQQTQQQQSPNNANNFHQNHGQRNWNRSYDSKRPKAKTSAYNNGTNVNQPDQGCADPENPSRAQSARLDLEEDGLEAELGSVFVPGSKKQSLNHLLNFVYVSYGTNDDREGGGAGGGGMGRHQGQGRGKLSDTRLIATRKHKYNKEHFLQANCQFVVDSSGDYRQYRNNPDALVDWNLIEQVNVQVSEPANCPICLYPPVAAKITRCGHIYCWSCLLHYLSLSDKTWRKCPICYDSVHKHDLRSVITVIHDTLNVNDMVTFKLMKRPKGSLVVYEADGVVNDDVTDPHAKLLMADRNEILGIVERESDELNVQLREVEHCPEKCFTEQALVFLEQRRETVLDKVTARKEVSCREQESILLDNLRDEDQSVQSTPQKMYYFYQASDGQHLYLHALNARMLEHTYGSLEFGPKTLTGKILEKEGGSMTEDIRKRLRYLQHLPVTCQFEVAEIQLKQPDVNKDTLDYFNDQIETRRRRRQRRFKEEKKREKKIAVEEDRLFGRYPVAELHLESQEQFPCFEAKPKSESEYYGGNIDDTSSDSMTCTPCSSLTTEYGGPSFAKMLTSAKKSDDKWPTLKGAQTETTKLINVTGQKMKSASFQLSSVHNDSDTEVDGLVPVPPCHRSFGDAISEALQKAHVDDGAQQDQPQSGKKKKKKNKQKILFTTNVAFSDK